MDPVKIAYGMASLFEHKLGDRRKFYDSDVICDLANADMGRIAKKVADVLSKRAKRIAFDPRDERTGRAREKLDVAILEFRNLEKALRKSRGKPVAARPLLSAFGASMWTMSALLEMLERQSTQIRECREILRPKER